MNPEESASEQRKFSRLSKEIAIEVNKLSYPISKDPGERRVCKNISGGGICITVPRSYEAKTLLSMRINIPGWQGYKKPFSMVLDISSESSLTAIGEVSWCKKLSDGSGYEIGIRFLDIYEDDYRALTEYLKNQS